MHQCSPEEQRSHSRKNPAQRHMDKAAAAKSLQSCLTLCDPIDGSPPGSPVPGILQARVLEWGAIAFSIIIGDWNAKVGSQETPGVTGKFGLGIWNEAGQRKCTGYSKHPVPTTQEKTLYMDITRWSTPKSD